MAQRVFKVFTNDVAAVESLLNEASTAMGFEKRASGDGPDGKPRPPMFAQAGLLITHFASPNAPRPYVQVTIRSLPGGQIKGGKIVFKEAASLLEGYLIDRFGRLNCDVW